MFKKGGVKMFKVSELFRESALNLLDALKELELDPTLDEEFDKIIFNLFNELDEGLDLLNLPHLLLEISNALKN